MPRKFRADLAFKVTFGEVDRTVANLELNKLQSEIETLLITNKTHIEVSNVTLFDVGELKTE